MSKCPICNRNPIDDRPRKATAALLSAYECTALNHNPGGCEFFFPFGRIQVQECCEWCDLETMMTRLLEMNKING